MAATEDNNSGLGFTRGEIIIPLIENGFDYYTLLDGLWKALGEHAIQQGTNHDDTDNDNQFNYRKCQRLHGICKQVRWRWNCTRDPDHFAKKYHAWLDQEFPPDEIPDINQKYNGAGYLGRKTKNEEFVEQSLKEATDYNTEWTGLRKGDILLPILDKGFNQLKFVESMWLALTDVEHFEITDYEYDFWNCPRLKSIQRTVYKKWSTTKSRKRFGERHNIWLQEEFMLDELPTCVIIPSHHKVEQKPY